MRRQVRDHPGVDRQRLLEQGLRRLTQRRGTLGRPRVGEHRVDREVELDVLDAGRDHLVDELPLDRHDVLHERVAIAVRGGVHLEHAVVVEERRRGEGHLLRGRRDLHQRLCLGERRIAALAQLGGDPRHRVARPVLAARIAREVDSGQGVDHAVGEEAARQLPVGDHVEPGVELALHELGRRLARQPVQLLHRRLTPAREDVDVEVRTVRPVEDVLERLRSQQASDALGPGRRPGAGLGPLFHCAHPAAPLPVAISADAARPDALAPSTCALRRDPCGRRCPRPGH